MSNDSLYFICLYRITLFTKPPIKSNADEIIIVIKTSGTKAFATYSGVAKNIGTSNNIKIGSKK